MKISSHVVIVKRSISRPTIELNSKLNNVLIQNESEDEQKRSI